jgi:hypothetical protein
VLSFKKKAGVRLGLRVTLGYWLIEDEVGGGGVSLALLRF